MKERACPSINLASVLSEPKSASTEQPVSQFDNQLFSQTHSENISTSFQFRLCLRSVMNNVTWDVVFYKKNRKPFSVLLC